MTTSRDQRRDEVTKNDLDVLHDLYVTDPAFASLFASYLLQARSHYESYQRMCLQMSHFAPPAYRERLKSFAMEAEAPKFLSLLPEALTRLQTPKEIDGYDERHIYRDPADKWYR